MDSKIVAITGAYKGLGAALSKALAAKRCRLFLGGRNPEELEKFTKEMQKQTEAISVVVDVRSKKDCERFIKTAVEKFGRIDILINNAGILKLSSIDEVTEEEIKDTFETNVYGPIFCSQAAVKEMRKHNSGLIINIGSTSAVDYKKNHISYGSSKSAVVGFSGSLKAELEGTGIKVIVVSPGGMKTELFRSKPEIMRDDFMNPALVAGKIVEMIDNPPEELHIIIRRPTADHKKS